MKPRKRTPIDVGNLLRESLTPPADMPDFVTFAESPHFAGDSGPGLYPKQRTIGRLLYADTEHMTDFDLETIERWRRSFYDSPDLMGVPFDIWDRINWLKERGRRHFSHLVFIGGRRAGKGHLGALIIAYEWHYLLGLGDPQGHYGLARGKLLRTQVIATRYDQARDNVFADLLALVTNAPCFRPHLVTATRRYLTLMTSADRDNLEARGGGDPTLRREFASLRAQAISSSAAGSRGATNNFIVFDEFAHFAETSSGTPKAEEVYRALAPSVAQMQGDGLIYVPTSPWTRDSFAHKLYLDGIETDERGTPTNPDFLVVQLPSWGPFESWDDLEATEGRVFVSAPMRLDEDTLAAKRRDPISFQVEYAAQWADVEGGYLDSAAVDRMFRPFCIECGAAAEGESCSSCGGGLRTLGPTLGGPIGLVYRAHADAGESQSAFALVIGHAEPFGEVFHVIIDLSVAWRPENYENRQLPYMEIEAELADIVASFPSLRTLSVDQYAALSVVPHLQERIRKLGHRAGVQKKNFTQRSNWERAETFKWALGEGWIHAYPDDLGPNGSNLLRAELASLRLKGTRLEKPNVGPTRSKDVADCAMVVTVELLADHLKRGPIRHRLGATPLLAAPGYGWESTGSARERLNAIGRATANPYGRYVPPDPPTPRRRSGTRF